MKCVNSIAEYAIRSWLQNQNFATNNFELIMSGNEGILKDRNGDTITLIYDGTEKVVYMKD